AHASAPPSFPTRRSSDLLRSLAEPEWPCMSQLIDLSHTIESGMVTYPGLPAPVITDHLSRTASRAVYAQGTEFHIGRIDMVGNTGTYIDSPFHRFETGRDVAALDLAGLAGLPGIVVRAQA